MQPTPNVLTMVVDHFALFILLIFLNSGQQRGTVVSIVASQQLGRVWGGGRCLSMWSLHVLHMSLWVLSGYFGFHSPKTCSRQFVNLSNSKLPIVNMSVNSCLPLCVSPMMN